jgi:hypothetical protein
MQSADVLMIACTVEERSKSKGAFSKHSVVLS